MEIAPFGLAILGNVCSLLVVMSSKKCTNHARNEIGVLTVCYSEQPYLVQNNFFLTANYQYFTLPPLSYKTPIGMIQKYVEKDGKGLLMVIKVYIVAEKNGEGAAYVEDQMRKGSRQGVSMMLGTKESRESVLNLYKIEVHMGHMTAFTLKWIKDHILGTYGWVSELNI